MFVLSKIITESHTESLTNMFIHSFINCHGNNAVGSCYNISQSEESK